MSAPIIRCFKTIKVRVGITTPEMINVLGVMLAIKSPLLELLVHQEFGEGFTIRYRDPWEMDSERSQWRRVVFQGMPFLLLPGKKEALEIAENILRVYMEGACWEVAVARAAREWAVTMGVGWEEWKRETWDSWMRRYGSLKPSAGKPAAMVADED
jgi:hypothetical protein